MITDLIAPFTGGDDPLFGFMCNFTLDRLFDPQRLELIGQRARAATGPVVLLGTGAFLAAPAVPCTSSPTCPWEIQQRRRRGRMCRHLRRRFFRTLLAVTAPAMLARDQDRLNLDSEARRVREAGALGRSDVLGRLFDFLLECSLASRAPKEIEIAQEVFGKGSGFDMVEDASVRVYIHRLRRKLQEFYAETPGGRRLVIPLGEYRLLLVEGAEEPPAEVSEAQDPAPAPARPRWWEGRRLWAAIVLLAAINLLAWYVVASRQPASASAAVEDTAFWRPLVRSERPTFIVTGDYFIFGEAPDTMQVTRLVREFGINSREDLDRYLMDNPAHAGRYVDLDLHYLPVSTAYALRELLPLATGMSAGRATSPRLVTMSQITAERFKSRNIIYVGFLSGLGLLRDPLFGVSGFSVGATYDELVDRKSGRRYVSDPFKDDEGGTPRRDYGYLASLPGPAGNRILIVAGARDAGVMQAAEVAADPARLAEIAARTGGAEAFEALYEVRTIGNINLDSALVLARPLRAGSAWRPDPSIQRRFPDQPPEGRARAAR